MSDRKATPDIMDQLLAGKSKAKNTGLQKTVITVLQETRLTEKYNIKVTINLSDEEMNLLNDIRRHRLASGYKRSQVDNSKLIREAIQLLSLQNPVNL